MKLCERKYIPPHLHQNEREKFDTFSVGEFLYFRCEKEVVENPYHKISISELSHNRSGENNALSKPEDVLWNISADTSFKTYEGLEICELKIVDLNPESKYSKSYPETKKEIEYNCLFELFHEPEPCMYPHVVFRVTLNGEVIQKGKHYNDTIGKLNKIRNSLKEEIASMIVRREISQQDIPI